jgi:HD superfamily phosphohydrolase YqeK
MTHDERVSELLWSCLGYDQLCEMLADAEAENAKLREFASLAHDYANEFYNLAGTARDLADLNRDYADLGIEV